MQPPGPMEDVNRCTCDPPAAPRRPLPAIMQIPSTATNNRGIMIELGGKRWAVGSMTARLTRILAIATCLSYISLIVIVLKVRIIGEQATALRLYVLPIAALMIASSITFLYIFIQGSENQSINKPDKSKPISRQSGRSVSRILTSPLVWPSLVVMTSMTTIQTRSFSQFSFSLNIMALAMILHGTALLMRSRQLVHDAQLKNARSTSGLFRGFDWRRVNGDEESWLRTKLLSPSSWEVPKNIMHPSEASVWAHQARRIGFRWLTINAIILLLIVVVANQKDLISSLINTGSSTGKYLTTFIELVGIVMVPLAIQRRVGNLSDLAKKYEEREKSLREPPKDSPMSQRVRVQRMRRQAIRPIRVANR